MTKISKILFTIIVTLSGNVWGALSIENITLRTFNTKQMLRIDFKGELKDIPEWEIRNKLFQVSMPTATVWPKIEKKISLQNKNDTTLMAYQYTKDTARVRTLLPYDLNGKDSLVQVIVKKNHLLIELPGPPKNAGIKSIKKISKSIENITEGLVYSEKLAKKLESQRVQKYDEKLLDNLLRDNKKNNNKNETLADLERTKKTKLDSVSLKMSANQTANQTAKKSKWNENFSILGYFGKFLAFLGIVLLLFYGVINLMKKGVLNKGKLGFLNKMNTVSVLSSTYLAPKKNVHVVKAHNQIFLLATSEKGVHFLSELKDPVNILKNGERDIAGNNFDTTLDNNQDKDFKVKDILSDGTDAKSVENSSEQIERPKKSKFSEQIKNKVKGLKSLQ